MPIPQCFLLDMLALWHWTLSFLCLVGSTGLEPGGFLGSTVHLCQVSQQAECWGCSMLPFSHHPHLSTLTDLCFPRGVHICGVLRLSLVSGDRDQRHFPLGWGKPQSKFNKCSSWVVLERKRSSVWMSGFAWLPVPKVAVREIMCWTLLMHAANWGHSRMWYLM